MNERGFAPILIVLGIVFITFLGLTYWYQTKESSSIDPKSSIAQKNISFKNNNVITPIVSNASAVPVSNQYDYKYQQRNLTYLTYADPQLNFTFQYPSSLEYKKSSQEVLDVSDFNNNKNLVMEIRLNDTSTFQKNIPSDLTARDQYIKDANKMWIEVYSNNANLSLDEFLKYEYDIQGPDGNVLDKYIKPTLKKTDKPISNSYYADNTYWLGYFYLFSYKNNIYLITAGKYFATESWDPKPEVKSMIDKLINSIQFKNN